MYSDTYMYSTFMNTSLLTNPSPCFLLCPSSTPCINEPPLLLTWRSLFWWLWCECPSTLVPGWWLTAHPLLPNPPPPLPALPTVHVTCLQRRHHNISYTIWYKYASPRYGWAAFKHFFQKNFFFSGLRMNFLSKTRETYHSIVWVACLISLYLFVVVCYGCMADYVYGCIAV
jgi:hypothetical protein